MNTRRFTPFDPDAISQASPPPVLAGEAPEEDGDGPGTARPLTRRQKFILADLARHSFQRLQAQGQLAGVTLEAWRHQVAVQACGHRISEATLGDFKTIQAALLHAVGDEAGERRAMMQAQGTPLAIALFKLGQILRETNTPRAYAETLARRFYKTANLADLTARQVWTLTFTIRNNASGAAGKGSPANRFKGRKAGRANV